MKTGFFEEAPGVKSSSRLSSFILLFFLMAFDIMLSRLEGFVIDYNFIGFNFLLLIAIFAPRYLHKLAELKFSAEEKKKEV
jgi:hypothetical protein